MPSSAPKRLPAVYFCDVLQRVACMHSAVDFCNTFPMYAVVRTLKDYGGAEARSGFITRPTFTPLMVHLLYSPPLPLSCS